MTLTDGIIVLVIGLMVGFMIFQMIKRKDESICGSCSYAKGCTDKIVKKKAL